MEVNDAPTVSDDLLGGLEDTPLVITPAQLVGNDFDQEGQTLSASVYEDAPSGFTTEHGSIVDNFDGTLTFTPDTDFVGDASFHYLAFDGNLNSIPAQVVVSFAAVNDAPTAVDDPTTGATYVTLENTSLTVDSASGVLGNDYDIDSGTLTAHLINSNSGTVDLQSDGGFTYTPSSYFFGADTFVYQASDGEAFGNHATVTITVQNINDAPIAGNDFYSVPEDGTITLSGIDGILSNDIERDNDPLTVEEFNPMGAYLGIGADGAFSYSPPVDFHGIKTFYYRVNDGAVDSNDATIQITVTPVNDAPIAFGDTYKIAAGNTLTVDGLGVRDNDDDPDGDDFTVQVISGPRGSLSFDPDGTFSYSPPAGFSGLDTFTYQASDGTLDSNVATVEISVVATKFYVVDSTHGDVFRYGADSTWTDSESLDGSNTTPIGATSNSAGDRLWVLQDGGSTTQVFAYDREGLALGNWTAMGISGASGIGTDEIDIWVVESTSNAVHRFSQSASITTGDLAPGSSFLLDGANQSPTGLTTDGMTIWVTDDVADKVFVYDTNGTLLGQWELDPVNADASGITLNPGGGTDLWVVDRSDLSVFRYEDGQTTLSGTQSATGSAPLAPGNVSPEGIADPPTNTPPVAYDDTRSAIHDELFYRWDDDGDWRSLYLLGHDSDWQDTLTYEITAQPANGVAAVIPRSRWSYDPAAGFVGTDSFQYRAFDGTDYSNTATITIYVTNQAPTGNAETWSVSRNGILDHYLNNDDEPEPLRLVATDPDGDSLAIAIDSPPSNGDLTLNGDIWTYTPDQDFAGQDFFVYSLFDGAATTLITMTIDVVNNAPVASSQTQSTPHGILLDEWIDGDNDPHPLKLTATDADGDPITFSIHADPQYGVVTLDGDEWTYLPDLGYLGIDTFEFVASDGTASSSPVTVSINVTNQKPRVYTRYYSVVHGNLLSQYQDADDYQWYPLEFISSDSDGHALEFEVTIPPQHGTVVINGNQWAYQADFGYEGPDPWEFVAFDGAEYSDPATIHVNVTNAAPISKNAGYNVHHGQLITESYTTNDIYEPLTLYGYDANGNSLTYRITQPPQHGVLTLDGAQFTYLADLDFVGTDTFQYDVFDGVEFSTVSSINMHVQNQPPVANNESYSVDRNNVLHVSASDGVLNNDTQGDQDQLIVTLESAPANGSIEFFDDGAFNYHHDGQSFLSDSFTYRIFDGAAYSIGTVNITINPNTAPIAAPDKYFLAAGQEFSAGGSSASTSTWGVLRNDFDAGGDALAASVLTTTTNGQLSLATDGTFVYTPANGFIGPDQFTYTVSDGYDTDIGTVTLVVVDEALVIDELQGVAGNLGTEFWLTFPHNSRLEIDNVDPYISITITGKQGTSGQVQIPGLDWTDEFVLDETGVSTVELPSTAQFSGPLSGFSNNAIRVSADAPVAVYGMNFSEAQTDGYLGFPVEALGNTYNVLTYPVGCIPI
ncbi:hypothetical protein Enr13x_53550 [Stieleria neptunia]|uniref:Cadherin-like domain-containing protein n=1 Tax=Stieleria neptunia TaxID=2527979 RepID=A0A518HX85_9BACT|nr:hypothetical protein Enr13x_53550 [Stieleria neptunia]